MLNEVIKYGATRIYRRPSENEYQLNILISIQSLKVRKAALASSTSFMALLVWNGRAGPQGSGIPPAALFFIYIYGYCCARSTRFELEGRDRTSKRESCMRARKASDLEHPLSGKNQSERTGRGNRLEEGMSQW